MAKMRRQKGTRRTFKLTLQALVQRLSSLSLLKNSPSRGEGMHSWTISCKETISSMGFEGWEAGAKKTKKTRTSTMFLENKRWREEDSLNAPGSPLRHLPKLRSRTQSAGTGETRAGMAWFDLLEGGAKDEKGSRE